MNISYCDKLCPIGSKVSEEILNKNNSAFDAAIDFTYFVEECFKTCPYKEKHTEENIK